ncbi:hypothetical protein M378DRAFT_585065 [Amanita muscaria Koide BX008]|uniref:Uncharacterized protein n=1 Tax=Amanita muscaria (strain Koide BX008) TaxID=946122 RepID=A0A0C2X6N1_AMAMK|nr:hypothetical protein M378DRAFT_585065 [Amanita muscaria Koide BX008]
MNMLQHHPPALYHYLSGISASPRYDVPLHNSEGRDSHGFRHSPTVTYRSQFSPLVQNFDYCFDSFPGDHKAMRVKQNDITSQLQDNLTVNQEESRQLVSETRNAQDVCARLLSRSTFRPQAYGSLSSSMKEAVVFHNAEPTIYDGERLPLFSLYVPAHALQVCMDRITSIWKRIRVLPHPLRGLMILFTL